MTHPFKLALAAAIVVALGVTTIYLVRPPSSPGVGGQPNSPSPSASPRPTDSPSPAVQCEDNLAGCAGDLAAGDHQSSHFAPGVSYVTPDGWRNVIDTAEIYKLDPPTVFPYVLLWSDVSIAAQDATCTTPDPTRGRKAADWIAMLTSHPGLVASRPVSVDVGTRVAAQQVEVALDPAWTATCPDHDGPNVTFLTQPIAGQGEYGVGRDERVLVTVVDVGKRTVVILSYGPVGSPESFATTMQAVRAVIASFRFSCTIAEGPCGTP